MKPVLLGLLAVVLTAMLAVGGRLDRIAKDTSRDAAGIVFDVGCVGAWEPEQVIHIMNTSQHPWQLLGVAMTCWTHEMQGTVQPGETVDFRYEFPALQVAGPLQLPGQVQTLDGSCYDFTVLATMIPRPRLSSSRVTLVLPVDQAEFDVTAHWLQPMAAVTPALKLVRGSIVASLTVGEAALGAEGLVTLPLRLQGLLPFDADEAEFEWVLEDRTSGEQLTQHLLVRRDVLRIQPPRVFLAGSGPATVRQRSQTGTDIVDLRWSVGRLSWRPLMAGMAEVAIPEGTQDGELTVWDDGGRSAAVAVVRVLHEPNG